MFFIVIHISFVLVVRSISGQNIENMLHRKGNLSNNKAITKTFSYRIKQQLSFFTLNVRHFHGRTFVPFHVVLYVTHVPDLQCKGPLCSVLKSVYILSIISCTRTTPNDLGFNTCFLISFSVRYIQTIIL
jgi:hypothetical protein